MQGNLNQLLNKLEQKIILKPDKKAKKKKNPFKKGDTKNDADEGERFTWKAFGNSCKTKTDWKDTTIQKWFMFHLHHDNPLDNPTTVTEHGEAQRGRDWEQLPFSVADGVDPSTIVAAVIFDQDLGTCRIKSGKNAYCRTRGSNPHSVWGKYVKMEG